MEDATTLQLVGAGCFGAILGWYLYYINRYRSSEVTLGDLVTVIGAIGGGAVLALFPAKSELFGAYGVGLFAGFFGYFLLLLVFVGASRNFTVEWFLDGRRRKLSEGDYIPEGSIDHPMGSTRTGAIRG